MTGIPQSIGTVQIDEQSELINRILTNTRAFQDHKQKEVLVLVGRDAFSIPDNSVSDGNILQTESKENKSSHYLMRLTSLLPLTNPKKLQSVSPVEMSLPEHSTIIKVFENDVLLRSPKGVDSLDFALAVTLLNADKNNIIEDYATKRPEIK